MPHHEAAAVANAFVDLAGVRMDQMKLQKLSYMAHGWTLAIADEPLIHEVPEAWDNGPVFRSIWNAIRDRGLSRAGKIVDYSGSEISADFSRDEAEILRHVWQKYGGYSARELSAMTHEPETPWWRAYFDHGRNQPIMNNDVRTHYRELAFAGRAERV